MRLAVRGFLDMLFQEIRFEHGNLDTRTTMCPVFPSTVAYGEQVLAASP
jgi:hypothetical protein